MQAVNTLHNLHKCGHYDRIIVVAHSLGTVVAYDMLRAYFSRICGELPPVASFGADFDEIDAANLAAGWNCVRGRQEGPARRKRDVPSQSIAMAAEKAGGDQKVKTWLVTDFVTLGSALTHATFLMCIGNTRRLLEC